VDAAVRQDSGRNLYVLTATFGVSDQAQPDIISGKAKPH
jgi:hypothetical protein